MTIPYRHQEILAVLADNPKGLTTADIYKIASSDAGSELPNKETVGKLLYTMRNASPRVITTSDAIGGAIHKITPHGLQQLAEATGMEAPAATAEEVETRENIELPPTETAPENNAGDFGEPITSIRAALNILQIAGYTILDPDNNIDSAFITIVESLRVAEKTKAAPTVARKPVKIDTLKRLGALMSDDIKTIFDDIAADIDSLDEAA